MGARVKLVLMIVIGGLVLLGVSRETEAYYIPCQPSLVHLGWDNPLADTVRGEPVAKTPACIPQGYSPPEKLPIDVLSWAATSCAPGEDPCSIYAIPQADGTLMSTRIFCTRIDAKGFNLRFDGSAPNKKGFTACFLKGQTVWDPFCPRGYSDLGNQCRDSSGRVVAKNVCPPGFGYVVAGGVGRCYGSPFNAWTEKQVDCIASDGRTVVRGYSTAIGCIPVGDIRETVIFFYRWVVGIVSGIVLLLIIFFGYQLLISRGDAETLKVVREQIVNLVGGVLLIIFSFVLLNAIGVDLLQLVPFVSR